MNILAHINTVFVYQISCPSESRSLGEWKLICICIRVEKNLSGRSDLDLDRI